jgi:periplasmic protein TonB
MMIKTAGGPALVSPIDFHERRTPRLSKAAWVATGIVLAAHVGLGVAFYHQRFELRAPIDLPDPPTTIITLERPVPPEPLKPMETPPAPNPPMNDTPAPRTPTDTVSVVVTDSEPVASTTLTFDKPIEIAAPDSPVREPVVTPAPAPVITNPSWSRQPSGSQLMAAYPRRAITDGAEGSATLNCVVRPNGAVTDCNVTRETPGGYGFGRAAQSLSRHFRVNPRTVNGAAEGSRVNINLRFNLPKD